MLMLPVATQSPQFGKVKVRLTFQTPVHVELLKSAIQSSVEPLPFSCMFGAVELTGESTIFGVFGGS